MNSIFGSTSRAARLLLSARAVLFDLDGTLIDTHIDFGEMRRELLRLARNAGVQPPLPDQTDVLGLVDMACQWLETTRGAAAAAEFRREAFAALEAIETVQCATPVLVDGSSRLLRVLQEQGIRVGIVTRNSRAVSERLVREGQLECGALVTRDDVLRTKPHPDHLLETLRMLSDGSSPGIAPTEAVMVGDHWMDVLGGQRAGCTTIGLLRGRTPDFFANARPDELVEDITELASAVEEGLSLSRRALFAMGGASLLTAAVGPADAVLPAGTQTDSPRQDGSWELDFSGIHSYCSHEHWGSLASFGMEPEGFRADLVPGAEPLRRTGLLDVLLEPYLSGWIAAGGDDPGPLAARAGVASVHEAKGTALSRLWPDLWPILQRHTTTGTFQAIREGIRILHGRDVTQAESVEAIDERIGLAYADLFSFYRRAMSVANLRSVIRPVHPAFYYRPQDTPAATSEATFMRTVLRIDPLLHMWQDASPQRDHLASLTGIEPDGPQSWRQFLALLFDHAAERGCLGIKQLQAYSRSLEFVPREDTQVRFRGNLSPAEVQAFQDWVVHECCRQAHERSWPHQIHVGTHNLPHSNPLPLSTLAARYRGMRLVLLHCWPYHAEAGWLAWQHPNVFLDACWLAVLNPTFLRTALDEWLGLVPAHKIMCGHDATSIEMAVGAAAVLRRTLGELLQDRVVSGALRKQEAYAVASAILHRNAEQVYRWSAPTG